MVATLSQLPKLTKDTRADAFMAADNPALIYRDKVKALFGLSDPMVIAIVVNSTDKAQTTSIFTPEAMQLVQTLSDAVAEIDNVDPEKIISLATEKHISGSDYGMDVMEFFELEDITTVAGAAAIEARVASMPLYQGSLVAKDGSATLIVVEMIDSDNAELTYAKLDNLLSEIVVPQSLQIHLAGEGATSGYLGAYIDSDAQRLNPLAGLIITLMIILAFRRFAPSLLANVIIAASVLMTLAIMAAAGVPFFVITNALPVILIGISVADAIHIFSTYYELQAEQTADERKARTQQTIVAAMVEMWRPITLTTLTTIAGFIGLYLASYMPPFKYMGLFSALGVAIAWLFSLVFLPAAMAWIKPQVSKSFSLSIANKEPDMMTRFITNLGGLSLKYAKTTIALAAVIIIAGVFGATNIVVDEDRIKTFHPSEAISKADKAINTHFDGSNYLDVVIETPEVEDLFEPKNLARIEALQQYAETLPHVNGSTSVVDYLKQMNKALNSDNPLAYVLPKTKEMAAQYFLLYTASSEPTDFDEEIDYDYRIANVRIVMDSGAYTDIRNVIEPLQTYVDNEFNVSEAGISQIKATLSGRAAVSYNWIHDLGKSHFFGVFIALFLVMLVSALLFKSAVAGVYALLPVAVSILLIYSSMAIFGISLGIGTSMFASVAIGLGVDFAIHTLDRLRAINANNPPQDDAAFTANLLQLYPNTGRALLFNFIAIACGFGVLVSSKVVPLTNFGAIVVLSVTSSFIASMTVLPALIKVFKPNFIYGNPENNKQVIASSNIIKTSNGRNTAVLTRALPLLVLVSMTIAAFVYSTNGQAASSDVRALTANQVINNVNNRYDGLQQSRKLKMTLSDKRGKQRVRETRGYRKYFGDEKRTVIFYLMPTNVKGTGFLTYDYKTTDVDGVDKDDDQWLYLPALRKVRRISSSDRGDYFLGTDFTYDDIKLEGKVDVKDYNFSLIDSDKEIDSEKNLVSNKRNVSRRYRIEATAKNSSIVKEVGYSRAELTIDSEKWMIIEAKYWGIKGRPLKTLQVSDIQLVDDIWTAHRLFIENHKSGHKTLFEFSEVDYKTAVKDSMFSKRTLKRGK
ncbi:MAG: Patched family protein [Moraxellaceae bacterium]|nr:MAG: Patched family protein [Moraxellaceae bacterium]